MSMTVLRHMRVRGTSVWMKVKSSDIILRSTNSQVRTCIKQDGHGHLNQVYTSAIRNARNVTQNSNASIRISTIRSVSAVGSLGVAHLLISVPAVVLLDALGGGLDGVHAGVPVGRADLAVLVGELEGVNEAEGLVDAAANRQIVDGDLAKDAVGVDEEEAAQSNALLLNQDAVVLANGVVLVRQQRDVDLAQAAVLLRCVGPCEQRVLGVGRSEDNAGTAGLKVGCAVAEGKDLGRAHEGPGHGHEAEDEPLLVGGVLSEADICGC